MKSLAIRKSYIETHWVISNQPKPRLWPTPNIQCSSVNLRELRAQRFNIIYKDFLGSRAQNFHEKIIKKRPI